MDGKKTHKLETSFADPATDSKSMVDSPAFVTSLEPNHLLISPLIVSDPGQKKLFFGFSSLFVK